MDHDKSLLDNHMAHCCLGNHTAFCHPGKCTWVMTRACQTITWHILCDYDGDASESMWGVNYEEQSKHEEMQQIMWRVDRWNRHVKWDSKSKSMLFEAASCTLSVHFWYTFK